MKKAVVQHVPMSDCGFSPFLLFFEDWDFQIDLKEKGLSKNPNLNALVQRRSGGQVRAPAVHYVMGAKAKGPLLCFSHRNSTASDGTISASV